jgi:hypothetical protein
MAHEDRKQISNFLTHSSLISQKSQRGELTSEIFALLLPLLRQQASSVNGRGELPTAALHRPVVSMDEEKHPRRRSCRQYWYNWCNLRSTWGVSLTIRSIAFVSQYETR